MAYSPYAMNNREKYNPELHILNVTWEKYCNSNVYYIRPKSYLLGVVDKRNNKYIVNNFITKECIQGEAETLTLAKNEVVKILLSFQR